MNHVLIKDNDIVFCVYVETFIFFIRFIKKYCYSSTKKIPIKTTLTSTRSTNYNCSFIDSVHYQTENNKQRCCTVKSIWSTNFNHLHRICTESCNYTCILIFTHYMVKNVRESFFIIAIMQLEGHKVRCTKWYRNTFKDEL